MIMCKLYLFFESKVLESHILGSLHTNVDVKTASSLRELINIIRSDGYPDAIVLDNYKSAVEIASTVDRPVFIISTDEDDGEIYKSRECRNCIHMEYTKDPSHVLIQKIISLASLQKEMTTLKQSVMEAGIDIYQKTREFNSYYTPTCLIVEDDPNVVIKINNILLKCEEHIGKIRTLSTDNVNEAINIISDKEPLLVFLDINLSQDGDRGFKIFDKIENKNSVIYITADYSTSDAVSELKKGALDFLEKPIKTQKTQLFSYYLQMQKDFRFLNYALTNQRTDNDDDL